MSLWRQLVTALVLAAIGLYGVLAGSVTERTREIGVRMAPGASRGEIVSLVVRQAMAMTLAGVLIGAAGAVFASRGLQSLLLGSRHAIQSPTLVSCRCC